MSDELSRDGVFDMDEIINTAGKGFLAPVCFRLARPAGSLASIVATGLLILSDVIVESMFGNSAAETYLMLRSFGKVMLLAGVGELLLALARRLTEEEPRPPDPNAVTPYDCVVTMLLGFMVFSEVIEAVQTIMGPDFDSATFTGLFLAGVAYSVRDTLSCLLAGIAETVNPRFHENDVVEIGGQKGVRGRLVGRSLLTLRVKTDQGVATVPANMLTRSITQKLD